MTRVFPTTTQLIPVRERTARDQWAGWDVLPPLANCVRAVAMLIASDAKTRGAKSDLQLGGNLLPFSGSRRDTPIHQPRLMDWKEVRNAWSLRAVAQNRPPMVCQQLPTPPGLLPTRSTF